MSGRGGKRRQVLQLGSASKLHRYGYSKGFHTSEKKGKGSLPILVGNYSNSDSEDSEESEEHAATDMKEEDENLGSDTPDASAMPEQPADIDDELKNFLSEIEAIPAPPETDSTEHSPAPIEDVKPEPEKAVGADLNVGSPVETVQDTQKSLSKTKQSSYNYSMFVKGESEFVHSPKPDTEDVKSPAVAKEEDIPDEPTTSWQMVKDENTHYYYYWNTATNVVTWEIPTEYTQYLLLHREYEEKVAKYTPEQLQKLKEKHAKTTGNDSGDSHGDVVTRLAHPEHADFYKGLDGRLSKATTEHADRGVRDTTRSRSVSPRPEAGQDSRHHRHKKEKKSHHKKKHKRKHDDSQSEEDRPSPKVPESRKQHVLSSSDTSAVTIPAGSKMTSIVPYLSDQDDSDEDNNSDLVPSLGSVAVSTTDSQDKEREETPTNEKSMSEDPHQPEQSSTASQDPQVVTTTVLSQPEPTQVTDVASSSSLLVLPPPPPPNEDAPALKDLTAEDDFELMKSISHKLDQPETDSVEDLPIRKTDTDLVEDLPKLKTDTDSDRHGIDSAVPAATSQFDEIEINEIMSAILDPVSATPAVEETEAAAETKPDPIVVVKAPVKIRHKEVIDMFAEDFPMPVSTQIKYVAPIDKGSVSVEDQIKKGLETSAEVMEEGEILEIMENVVQIVGKEQPVPSVTPETDLEKKSKAQENSLEIKSEAHEISSENKSKTHEVSYETKSKTPENKLEEKKSKAQENSLEKKRKSQEINLDKESKTSEGSLEKRHKIQEGSVEKKSKPRDSLEKNKSKAQDSSTEKSKVKTLEKSRSRTRENSSEKIRSKTSQNNLEKSRSKTQENTSEKVKDKTYENSCDKVRSKTQENSSEKSRFKTQENSSEKIKGKTYANSSDKVRSKAQENGSDKSRSKTRENSPEKVRSKARETSSEKGRHKTREKTTEKIRSKPQESCSEKSRKKTHKSSSGDKNNLAEPTALNSVNIVGYASDDEEEGEVREAVVNKVEKPAQIKQRDKKKESRKHLKDAETPSSGSIDQKLGSELVSRVPVTLTEETTNQLVVEKKPEKVCDDDDIDFDVDDIDRALEVALEKKLERKKIELQAVTDKEAKVKDETIGSVSSRELILGQTVSDMPGTQVKGRDNGLEMSEEANRASDPMKKVSHDNKVEENSQREDDKLVADIKNMAELALSKLEFLDISTDSLSRLQVLFIELQTRFTDWASGGLSTQYFHVQLKTAEQLLEQYELSAVPEGWACQWDRSNNRYYYRNKVTNSIQWEYPEVDDKADVEAAEPAAENSDESTSRVRERGLDENHRSRSSGSSRHRRKEDKEKSKYDKHSSSRHYHRKRRRGRDHSNSSYSSSESQQYRRHRKSKKKKRHRAERSPSVEIVEHTDDNLDGVEIIEPPEESTTVVPPQTANSSPSTPVPPASPSASLPAVGASTASTVGTQDDVLSGMEAVSDDVDLDGFPLQTDENMVCDPDMPGEEQADIGAQEDVADVVNPAVISKPPQIVINPQLVAALNSDTHLAAELYSTAQIVTPAQASFYPSYLVAPPTEQTAPTAEIATESSEASLEAAKKKKKDKKTLATGSSLMMKKKHMSSMVQKWQKVKIEVEKEDRAKEIRQAAIRRKIEELKNVDKQDKQS